MKYNKVFITFWDYNEDIKICCYTNDGISYIVTKYKYNFFKTKRKYYIFNKLDAYYFIEYYENKYRNMNINLKYFKLDKIYIVNTIDKYHKIDLFFKSTEVDPPPTYRKSSLIPYNYLDINIPDSKLKN